MFRERHEMDTTPESGRVVLNDRFVVARQHNFVRWIELEPPAKQRSSRNRIRTCEHFHPSVVYAFRFDGLTSMNETLPRQGCEVVGNARPMLAKLEHAEGNRRAVFPEDVRDDVQ